MLENLRNYNIILASNSPRRKELLASLDIDFEVKTIKDIDESFPEGMPTSDIALYIAGKKADAYLKVMKDNELIITADTIVVVGDKVLEKPKDAADAHAMLRMLSGRTHTVVTGVCLTARKYSRRFSVTTDVNFSPLTDEEIEYYISHYRPFDKAGAYGIQEWIGYVGVSGLRGSYFNVMGLPVQRIYHELKKVPAI